MSELKCKQCGKPGGMAGATNFCSHECLDTYYTPEPHMTTCSKCLGEFNLHDKQASLENRNYGQFPGEAAQYFLCPKCNTWKNRSITVGTLIEQLQKYNSDWPVVITCRHHEDGAQVGQLVNIRKIDNKEGGHWQGTLDMVMLEEETRWIEKTSEGK